MTTGLVIGKFYPPHKGHHHLIRVGRSQVDRLVVMLCVHLDQVIPGELRKAWLEEVHPDCDVISVPDELPDDSEAWARFTLSYFAEHGWPSPDVVFSSEDYGDSFAHFMDASHKMVDHDRALVPISATAIRAAPLDNLGFLEPCVRAYFVRRVVLIGAESTGKTTLAERLADRFQTSWVPEYGREYWESRLAETGGGPSLLERAKGLQWTTAEFLHIAQEQQRRENLAARTANRVLLCDTNAFATGIWHERYMGFRSAEVDAIGQQDIVHRYLLAVPDFPFVQDGFRDGEDIRDWMHLQFVNALKAYPTTFLQFKKFTNW
jgi:NadR type nicotinamide-nucleotide adenylyltransferase